MTDPSNQRVLDDIAKFGCHVVHVFDPQQNDPSFSYSVGIQATVGQPEAIVVGLGQDISHFIVNEYHRRVQAGERFEPGVLYSGFLGGFPVYIEPTSGSAVLEYARYCSWYYQERPFSVAQIIYPTTAGVWPWQSEASDWFKTNQPLLGRLRPDLA